jgi:hypothetical protein
MEERKEECRKGMKNGGKKRSIKERMEVRKEE